MEITGTPVFDQGVDDWPDPGWGWPVEDGGPPEDDGWPPVPAEVWDEVVRELVRAVEPAESPGRELWQLSDSELVAELGLVQRRRTQVEARWLAVLGEAERREACRKETGLTTASWLVDTATHSPRRARQDVALARRLEEHPAVAAALGAGRLSTEQAQVICHGLGHLPDTLSTDQRHAVTAQLLALAGEFGPAALRSLVTHAVEVVAPQVAEDADRRAVERADRHASRSRFLSWHRDLDGGLLISGKLTAATGDQFAALITAHAARHQTSDTITQTDTGWPAACADALATILAHYAGCSAAPRHGGDRPRVILTLDLPTLIAGLGTATLLGSGEPITAATARRLACDAGIVPAILDGASQPLDVGREQRLFTGALRHALTLRDQGCAFPGCDRPPADCDGHHIRPWWNGGHTSLANAMLLCQRHHTLIEPDPHKPPGSQWQARLDHHGLPEFLAPHPHEQPPDHPTTRQHHRYRTRHHNPQAQ